MCGGAPTRRQADADRLHSARKNLPSRLNRGTWVKEFLPGPPGGIGWFRRSISSGGYRLGFGGLMLFVRPVDLNGGFAHGAATLAIPPVDFQRHVQTRGYLSASVAFAADPNADVALHRLSLTTPPLQSGCRNYWRSSISTVTVAWTVTRPGSIGVGVPATTRLSSGAGL